MSVEEYHRLIREGFFAANERVELINGLLVEKMSKNPPHAAVLTRLREALEIAKPGDSHLRIQDPVTLVDSEPEPDLAIVRGSSHAYVQRHPSPPEVLLLIEVSDSTLDFDLSVKLEMYAKAGIVPYIVASIPEKCLHVFTELASAAYAPAKVFREHETATIQFAESTAQLKVAELFAGISS